MVTVEFALTANPQADSTTDRMSTNGKTPPTTVFVVEAQTAIRELIADFIRRLDGFEVVGTSGRRDDAERLFKRLVGLANDVGLLSEEYDPRAKRHLGNFPQAFSHVALINTAFNLTRAEKPAEQRSELPKGTAKAAETASA